MITLQSCPKAYTQDQDKAISPADTVARVRERLGKLDINILAETRRVDVGRLGIPVFLSVCGEDARAIMPTRKQMGKGASLNQAQASALMELIERYSFFTFWRDMPNMVEATWSEAESRFGDALIPIEEILRSVHDATPAEDARRILDLHRWKFFPATNISTGQETWLPLDWFKKLGEFNGSSAGNTEEESILQGSSELIERHVCCIIDRTTPELPTINPASCTDPVLAELLAAFEKQGINLVLKDFSLGMPMPTVAAIAWDPATFPAHSEIVYTAGTASSPVKAAIRAVTEVAQLAGDFCTNACYEASGLSKYEDLDDIQWLLAGPVIPLAALPSIECDDILKEINIVCAKLKQDGYSLFSISTMNPALGINAHYNMIPGFHFRERDRNASLGLFVGRILSEEYDAEHAMRGLALLENLYPSAHYIPFFKGMLALRAEAFPEALQFFEIAEPLQPEADSRGLAAFYSAYTRTLTEQWEAALPALARAIEACPDMKEYHNLRGVCRFKLGEYHMAATDFEAVLRIDKGSVIDLANLGLCHKFMGNRERATELLVAALELDPNLGFARTHLEELTSSQ